MRFMLPQFKTGDNMEELNIKFQDLEMTILETKLNEYYEMMNIGNEHDEFTFFSGDCAKVNRQRNNNENSSDESSNNDDSDDENSDDADSDEDSNNNNSDEDSDKNSNGTDTDDSNNNDDSYNRGCWWCGSNEHFKNDCRHYMKVRDNLYCEHCNVYGHTKEICFVLHPKLRYRTNL